MYPVPLLNPPPTIMTTKPSAFSCPIIGPSRLLSKSREQTLKKHNVVFTVFFFTSNEWMNWDKGGDYFGYL